MIKYFLILATALLSTHYTSSQPISIGDIAPDIVLTTYKGEKIKLSDYKGKLVLLEFWASWCAPCRKENSNLVSIYNKYKDENFSEGEQGFVIFSVSLDSRKQRWLEAIKKDELNWETHVCDLKGWRSKPAKEYGINAIPANYLINGNGEIIATDLRGKKLQATINDYKKSWIKGIFK